MPRSRFLVRLFAAALFVPLTLDAVAAERQTTRRPIPTQARQDVTRPLTRPQPRLSVSSSTASVTKPRPAVLPGTVRPQPQLNSPSLRRPIAPRSDGTGSRGNPNSGQSIHFLPRRPPATQPKDNTLEQMRLQAQIDLAKRREQTELVQGILGGVAGIVQGAVISGSSMPESELPAVTYLPPGNDGVYPSSSAPRGESYDPVPQGLELVYPEEGALFPPE